MSNITRTATTAEVRAYFNHPRYGASRVARLNNEKAAHTVVARPNLRGRLHARAVEVFNEAHEAKGVAYVSGATKAALIEARGMRDNLRAEAAEKGLAVSDKGPLSNEAKAALGILPEKKATKKSSKK